MPRLSFQYYEGAVIELLGQLKTVDKHCNSYNSALERDVQTEDATKVSMTDSNNVLVKVKKRIQFLGGNHGVLEAAADKISHLTPILKEKHSDFIDKLRNVEEIV